MIRLPPRPPRPATLFPYSKIVRSLGYSDPGFLLGALYARRIGRAAHGPMPIDIDRTGGDVTVTRSLAWLTAHDRKGFEPSRSEEHTSELQSLMRSSYAVF